MYQYNPEETIFPLSWEKKEYTRAHLEVYMSKHGPEKDKAISPVRMADLVKCFAERKGIKVHSFTKSVIKGFLEGRVTKPENVRLIDLYLKHADPNKKYTHKKHCIKILLINIKDAIAWKSSGRKTVFDNKSVELFSRDVSFGFHIEDGEKDNVAMIFRTRKRFYTVKGLCNLKSQQLRFDGYAFADKNRIFSIVWDEVKRRYLNVVVIANMTSHGIACVDGYIKPLTTYEEYYKPLFIQFINGKIRLK